VCPPVLTLASNSRAGRLAMNCCEDEGGFGSGLQLSKDEGRTPSWGLRRGC
jgi:hypothetical protein